MISLSQVTLRRGAKILFENTSLIIHHGQKIGLVGSNGAGKSSFMAMIRKELAPDAGDLDIPAWITFAHVAQETPALPMPAIDYVLLGDAPWIKLQAELKAAEDAHDALKQAELHQALHAIDGYSARARAAQLLAGLGFSEASQSRPVAEFSGGWRMRLNLAQALMCRSDVLLLDEPTNHLDLETVLWLEQWLNRYQGTLILISHDRDFLDATVSHIVQVDQQQLNLYSGTYSDFERQRAGQLALQQALFEKQQTQRKHLQSYIDRFRAQATKARQAQSRIKALERMEDIAAAHVDSPFRFGFADASNVGNPLIKLDKVSAGYGNTLLLKQISLSVQNQDRIGLLGVNGAGKSTLMKILAGSLTPQIGEIISAAQLRVGYYAQHQLEQLDDDASALLHLQRIDKSAREQTLRDYLGGFNFHGDQATECIAPFSGGEKARLALAILIYQKPNLLLLDEPTNHLDLEMREALTMALQDFNGAIVVISHDRHLLRATVDDFWLVEDGEVRIFEGDLEAYHVYRTQQNRDTNNTKINNINTNLDKQQRKEQRKQETQERIALAAKRKPLAQAIKKLEQQMAQLQQEKEAITQQLADPALYEPSNKIKMLAAQQNQQRIEQSLLAQEEEWLALTDQLEAIGGEA